MRRSAWALALVTTLAGCPTADPSRAAGSAATSNADAGDASREARAERDPKLPVPADFEEAADSEIDESNYAAELDAIAAELARDGG